VLLVCLSEVLGLSSDRVPIAVIGVNMGFLQPLHTSTWTVLTETVADPCKLTENKDIKVLLYVTP
jgi:hypothetical protein